MTLPQPKRGITPRDFYHQYIPELWAALVGPVPALVGVTAGVSVAGDGEYAIALTDAGLATSDGKPADALLVFNTDVASWRIALIELLPRVLKHIEPKVTPTKVALHLGRIDLGGLRKAPGSLTLVFEDDAGDEAKVVLTVGESGGPAASIHVTDTELWRLLESGIKLSQLVRSRVKVSGDLGYLLTLARVAEG
ncbi:MAG: hypothetical protein ACAI38_08760 [Myxococcota bacterium]